MSIKNLVFYKWDLHRKVRRLACLVLGHDIMYSYDRCTEDWCSRCWYHQGEINLDGLTLPVILHNIYVWIVEHNLGLFDRFDIWLTDSKYRKFLPEWWNY